MARMARTMRKRLRRLLLVKLVACEGLQTIIAGPRLVHGATRPVANPKIGELPGARRPAQHREGELPTSRR